jgi:hypothetical protein
MAPITDEEFRRLCIPLLWSETTEEQRVKMFEDDFGPVQHCPFCGRLGIDYERGDNDTITSTVVCYKCNAKVWDARWNRPWKMFLSDFFYKLIYRIHQELKTKSK